MLNVKFINLKKIKVQQMPHKVIQVIINIFINKPILKFKIGLLRTRSSNKLQHGKKYQVS